MADKKELTGGDIQALFTYWSVNQSVSSQLSYQPFDAHCYHMGTAISHPGTLTLRLDVKYYRLTAWPSLAQDAL